MSKLINLDDLVGTLVEQDVKSRDNSNSDRQPADENFLSCEAGHTYLVRLLPNIANPAQTFADYEEYGFKSITGAYIYAGRTPHSVGRKDVIKDLQWKTYSEGKKLNDEEMMKRSYTLFPQKKQMVNVLVIDDPVTPENNGKVKALRYSARLNKNKEPISPIYAKLWDAVFGDSSKEIGKRAFDLTKDGVTFAIKVKKNSGGWNDYSDSTFKFPSDLGLSEADIERIYGETLDLETLIPEVKSDEDLNSLLAIHWYGSESEGVQAPLDSTVDTVADDDDDDIPFISSPTTQVDDEMGSFLDGLENLED